MKMKIQKKVCASHVLYPASTFFYESLKYLNKIQIRYSHIYAFVTCKTDILHHSIGLHIKFW